jgi:hypothetical protein
MRFEHQGKKYFLLAYLLLPWNIHKKKKNFLDFAQHSFHVNVFIFHRKFHYPQLCVTVMYW